MTGEDNILWVTIMKDRSNHRTFGGVGIPTKVEQERNYKAESFKKPEYGDKK